MDRKQFEAIMCMLQAIMLQQRAMLDLKADRPEDAEESYREAWGLVKDAEKISGFKIP